MSSVNGPLFYDDRQRCGKREFVRNENVTLRRLIRNETAYFFFIFRIRWGSSIWVPKLHTHTHTHGFVNRLFPEYSPIKLADIWGGSSEWLPPTATRHRHNNVFLTSRTIAHVWGRAMRAYILYTLKHIDRMWPVVVAFPAHTIVPGGI